MTIVLNESMDRQIADVSNSIIHMGLESRRETDRWVTTAVVAVKIIAAVAAKVLAISDEKKKAAVIAEISQKLSAIISELQSIRSDLAVIKRQLDTIEEKIDEQHLVEALANIHALQQFVSENYEYWTHATDDVLVDAREARRNIITSNRMLMTGSRFSYAFDLAFSFSYELDLAVLLDVPKSAVRNASKKMLSYLEASIDPNVEGSIAYHHEVSKKVIEQLLSWEASLEKEKYIRTAAIKTQENIWSYVMCIIDVYEVVAGDLNTGLQRQQEYRNQRDCQAYQKEKGSGLVMKLTDEIEFADRQRALAEQGLLDGKNRLYAAHKPIVEFGEIAIPTIKRAMEFIEERTESQLPLAPDAP